MFVGLFSLVLGFAGVWHIWWLAIAALVGIVGDRDRLQLPSTNDGYYIPAATVADDRRETQSGAAAQAALEVELDVAENYLASAPRPFDGDDHVASHSVFGFWLYLMTDCVIFASLFAVFARDGRISSRAVRRQGSVRYPGRRAGNRRCCC